MNKRDFSFQFTFFRSWNLFTVEAQFFTFNWRARNRKIAGPKRALVLISDGGRPTRDGKFEGREQIKDVKFTHFLESSADILTLPELHEVLGRKSCTE